MDKNNSLAFNELILFCFILPLLFGRKSLHTLLLTNTCTTYTSTQTHAYMHTQSTYIHTNIQMRQARIP